MGREPLGDKLDIVSALTKVWLTKKPDMSFYELITWILAEASLEEQFAFTPKYTANDDAWELLDGLYS